MALSQRRSIKKESGKKYKHDRKKRKRELARTPALTTIGEKKVNKIRTLGGNVKDRTIRVSEMVIVKGKKHIKAKIVRVVKNPANRHFVRMNVITKGAIVETDKGLALVTNRPGQVGQVQGVYYKEE